MTEEQQSQTTQTEKKPLWKKWWLGALIVIIFIGILVILPEFAENRRKVNLFEDFLKDIHENVMEDFFEFQELTLKGDKLFLEDSLNEMITNVTAREILLERINNNLYKVETEDEGLKKIKSKFKESVDYLIKANEGDKIRAETLHCLEYRSSEECILTSKEERKVREQEAYVKMGFKRYGDFVHIIYEEMEEVYCEKCLEIITEWREIEKDIFDTSLE